MKLEVNCRRKREFSTTQMSTGIEPKSLKLKVFELAFQVLVEGANPHITDGLNNHRNSLAKVSS